MLPGITRLFFHLASQSTTEWKELQRVCGYYAYSETSQRNWAGSLRSPRIRRNSRRTSVLQLCAMEKEIMKFFLAGVVSLTTKGCGFTWTLFLLSGSVLNSSVKKENSECKVQAKRAHLFLSTQSVLGTWQRQTPNDRSCRWLPPAEES